MSALRTNSSGKSFHPMHSSYIFTKPKADPQPMQGSDLSKLSAFYTKATSQVCYTDNQQYQNIIDNYQNRIRNMELGFERSRQQFQNSFKNIYKQKIVLLNIISHNQALIDEFRNKLRLNTDGTFKEIETKYNIISSGLFHAQLCQTCIGSVSKADFQLAKDRESPLKSIKQKEKGKKMQFAKQYNWTYFPQEQCQAVIKIKLEFQKIKNSLEGTIYEINRKISDKNRQNQYLKTQLAKAMAPVHSIMRTSMMMDNEMTQKLIGLKQTVKHLESRLQIAIAEKEGYEGLLKELNQKLIGSGLEKLGQKYRARYY